MEILTEVFYGQDGLARTFYIEPVFGCSNIKLATGVFYLYDEAFYSAHTIYFLSGKKINCNSIEEFEKILKLKAFL